MKVTLNQNVLTDNELAAAYNREQFQKRKILAVNMMSSPGAGKTTLLEKTVAHFSQEFRIGVIEGIWLRK